MCKSPSSFNPLTATAAEIAEYGLPKRPEKDAGLDVWLDLVKSVKQRICLTNEETMPGHHHIYSVAGLYWSGYIAESANGAAVRAVYGYYTPYRCDTTGSSHIKIVAWVGIGGFNSPDLWQAGIENDYSTSGGPFYWYDEFPKTGIIKITPGIGYTCGDELYTYVDYNYTTPGDAYYIITDRTTGKGMMNEYNYAPSQNSAEWIDERPGCGGNNNYALGNFYTDEWSGYYWDVEGNFYSIGGSGSYYYEAYINQNGNIAYPGSLYQVGSHPAAGFIDWYDGTGTSGC